MSSARSLVIVITGASRGLGAGMAETYLAKGHKLGICARSSSASFDTSTYAEKVLYQSVDVCNPEAIQSFLDAVVAKFGSIDLWINNAGIIGPIQPIRNTNYEEFNTNIQINLGGVFHGTKAYINHVRSQSAIKDATLINISSGAAVKGYAGWGAYCSSKGAVDRLTECAFIEEEEGGTTNLRAYSIAPGVIDTDMQAMIRSTSKEDFPMVDQFLEMKATDSFNTSPFVAQKIEELALLEGSQSLPVIQRLPNEK
jgi:benzil reductase ((S)-benzoin forming)